MRGQAVVRIMRVYAAAPGDASNAAMAPPHQHAIALALEMLVAAPVSFHEAAGGKIGISLPQRSSGPGVILRLIVSLTVFSNVRLSEARRILNVS